MQFSASAGARAQDADFALRAPGPQVKQNWNLTDKNFVATSNSRNENMLREAGEFAGHLKRCEKEIRTLKNATEGVPSPACSLPCFGARSTPCRLLSSPCAASLAWA